MENPYPQGKTNYLIWIKHVPLLFSGKNDRSSDLVCLLVSYLRAVTVDNSSNDEGLAKNSTLLVEGLLYQSRVVLSNWISLLFLVSQSISKSTFSW